METRKQLTEKQFKIINEVSEKVARAQAALQEQQEKAQFTQALIFEAHGIPDGARVGMDPETRELIVELPDEEPPKKAAPAKK